MTKLKLKKHLATLPKEDVIRLVLDLYDANKEAKMYLEMYLTPDYSAALEKYKKIIRDEFFRRRLTRLFRSAKQKQGLRQFEWKRHR